MADLNPSTPRTTGRLRKAAPDRLAGGIRFRLTPAQRVALEGRAADAGLSLSDFCRQAALTGHITARKSGSSIPVEIVTQLRRLGNNLNQILHAAHANRFPAPVAVEAEAALRDVSAYLRMAFHDPKT